MVSSKKYLVLERMLLVASILAAMKLIFVDYTMDEEYQIVMAYRRIFGEKLFGTMWEPHQTSAFACVFLMWPFRMLTGGYTGVIVYLRICTAGIQLLLSLWLYRVLGKLAKRDIAYLAALCYFNIVPKNIQIPEFGNLQVWFYTVIVLALMEYYLSAGRSLFAGGSTVQEKKKIGLSGAGKPYVWLVIAGVGMALEVLSYPASLLIFPFVLLWIFLWSGGRVPAAVSVCGKETAGGDTIGKTGGKEPAEGDLPGSACGKETSAGEKRQAFFWKKGLTDCFLLCVVCGLCAVIWLAVVLLQVPFDEFLRNVQNVLTFDLTHDISLKDESKLGNFIRGLLCLKSSVIAVGIGTALCLGGYEILTLLTGTRQKKTPETTQAQSAEPGTSAAGSDAGKHRLLAISLGMFFSAEVYQVYYWTCVRSGFEEPMIHLLICFLSAALVWRLADDRKKWLLPGILGAAFTILAVIYMSDLVALYAIPHGMVGSVLALLVLAFALESVGKEKSTLWVHILLISFCLVCMFGKGIILRAGATETNTIIGVRGIIKKGPGAGIITNYMQAYMANTTYEEFTQWIPEGTRCLIVTDLVRTPGTTPYLFGEYEISHFSIVDPTSYDERLMEYWKLYPEKRPDVIIVDCWYGQSKIDPNSWIQNYIDEEFGYSRVEDGKFYRYYFK